MPNKEFENKVCLITGGSTGIGKSAAILFSQEGAKIAIADINEEDGYATIKQINENGGTAIFIKADMTSHADIKNMVDETIKAFGQLDIAFNNAGTSGKFTNVVDCTEEEWDFVHSLNLKSVFLCMKYEIAAMLKTGGGAIVNTASEAANHPAPHMVSYVTTKAGVIGLTKSAAYDFADKNIRVNAILPGPTVTPMLMQGTIGLDRNLEVFGSHLPMKRVGRAEEQAYAAMWLTSQKSSFVTGQALSVDGGLNLG